MVMKSSSGEVILRLLPFDSQFNSALRSGKSIREGMGQATNRSSSETLDLVITNALVVDWSGIYKAMIIPHSHSQDLGY